MKIDKALIKQYENGISVVHVQGQLNHRGVVINKVCELEYELCSFITEFFTLRNKSLSKEKLLDELYSENGMLGSLNRISKMAYYLGLISEHINHDLQKLAKLRNRYAHDKECKQLQLEPGLFKFVTDTYLYNQNQKELKNIHPQEVFLLITMVLLEEISKIEIQA